jgi:hypothetical protein
MPLPYAFPSTATGITLYAQGEDEDRCPNALFDLVAEPVLYLLQLQIMGSLVVHSATCGAVYPAEISSKVLSPITAITTSRMQVTRIDRDPDNTI